MAARRPNPAADARAALIPAANRAMDAGLSPPAAWGVVLGLVQAGEPVAAPMSSPAAPASSPARPADRDPAQLRRELHREAVAISRERGIPLSEAFLVAGGLPAGSTRSPAPAGRWWEDSAGLVAETQALQRATGRPYGACFREITEAHALADRQAAAATFHERQGRANAGDLVAARMSELLDGATDHGAVRAALLAAGRELAGAAR